MAKSGFEIAGNKLYSKTELARLLNYSVGNDSILAQLRSLYGQAGYFSADFRWQSENNGIKTLHFSEGSPTLIGNLDVRLIPENSEINFEDIIRQVTGEIASKNFLNSFSAECISRLADIGMPFAQGTWRDFSFDESGRLSAVFEILPGPVIFISGFEFDGISRTRHPTLERAADIKIGQRYSESIVVRSQDELDKMPFIEISSPFILQQSSAGDSCKIIYHLKELPSTKFDFSLGFLNQDRKAQVAGRLLLDFGDIMGSGKSAGLFWEKKDKFSSQLRIRYHDPFVLGTRFGLSLEAFQNDHDSLFLETGGSAGIGHNFSGGLYAEAQLTVQRTEPEPGSIVSSSSSNKITAVFGYSNLDFKDNPSAGYEALTSLSNKYRSNGRVVLGNPATHLTSVELKGNYYLRIIGRLVLELGLNGWGIVNNDGDISADELRYIGGSDDLRGYSFQRFPAYRYFITTFESRLLSGRAGRAYIFMDIATIKSSPNSGSRYKIYPGYGIGIAAPTTLGQVKVEVGWGKSGFPKEAIVNFGLAGGF